MTLLEREPALEALEGALGEVAHGEGRVALVYGEAGIGKTSLVDCFARDLRGLEPEGVVRGPHGRRRDAVLLRARGTSLAESPASRPGRYERSAAQPRSSNAARTRCRWGHQIPGWRP
jgi:hypothetical protein